MSDQDTPHQFPKLYSVKTAASATGLSERTVRHLFDKRCLPLVKVQNRLYVRADDLGRYLETNTIPAQATGVAR